MRDLNFHPGEGYLYEIGGDFWLVYTGKSKVGWAASPSSLSAEFANVEVRGVSRDVVVRELVRRADNG